MIMGWSGDGATSEWAWDAEGGEADADERNPG